MWSDCGYRLASSIGEIDLRFQDETSNQEYLALHDYIKNRFQAIAAHLQLSEADLDREDFVGQMFTIAWTWLQPRRSFAELRDMFRTTLQCYESIIDIAGAAGQKTSQLDIKSARQLWREVRQHVAQIVNDMNPNLEIIVVQSGTKLNTHFDRSATDQIVMGYLQAVFATLPVMQDYVLASLDDSRADEIRDQLALQLKQAKSYADCQAAHEAAVSAMMRLFEEFLRHSSDAPGVHSSRSMDDINRCLHELSLFSADTSILLDLADDIIHHKLIIVQRVPPTFRNLYNVCSKPAELLIQPKPSDQYGRDDKPIGIASPRPFQLGPATVPSSLKAVAGQPDITSDRSL